MTKIAETERLRIRKFTADDTAFIFQLLNTPGWLKFIGDRNIKSEEDARLYLVNGPLFSYHRFGFGPYLVELKDSAEPIGMCSLIKRDSLPDVDLGFAFLQAHMGKGYGTEVSLAMIAHARNDFGIKKLVAITSTTNLPSTNLLKKLGFSCEGTIVLPGETEELLFFTHLSK